MIAVNQLDFPSFGYSFCLVILLLPFISIRYILDERVISIVHSVNANIEDTLCVCGDKPHYLPPGWKLLGVIYCENFIYKK